MGTTPEISPRSFPLSFGLPKLGVGRLAPFTLAWGIGESLLLDCYVFVQSETLTALFSTVPRNLGFRVDFSEDDLSPGQVFSCSCSPVVCQTYSPNGA